MMKHVRLFSAAVFAMLFLAAPAFADSPHWVNTSATISQTTGALDVAFKVAGLGSNVLDTITLNATASAVYQCFNNGGKNPKAGNKTTVTAPVSNSGSFPSGKNGAISSTISVDPPAQGSFSCPSGQTLYLQSVSYTGVSLSDTSGAGNASISGTFSALSIHIQI